MTVPECDPSDILYRPLYRGPHSYLDLWLGFRRAPRSCLSSIGSHQVTIQVPTHHQAVASEEQQNTLQSQTPLLKSSELPAKQGDNSTGKQDKEQLTPGHP